MNQVRSQSPPTETGVSESRPAEGMPPGGGPVGGPDGLLRSTVFVVLVGVMLSVLAAVGLARLNRAKAVAAFHENAKANAEAIRRETKTLEEVAHSVVALHDSSERVERPEFASFVANSMARHPEINSLMWLRRVAAAEKDRLVAEARADGLTGFEVTELGRDGVPVAVGAREEYYVTWAVEPPARGADLLGFDHGSVPDRAEALLRCADSGAMSVTGPVRFVSRGPEGEAQRPGVIAFVPVYRHGANTTTVTGRRAGLTGFIGVAIEVETLVASEVAAPAMDVGVFDDAGTETKLVAFVPSRPVLGGAPARAGAGELWGPEAIAQELQIGGRTWRVVCAPPGGRLAVVGAWQPWGLMGVGLLITGLTAATLSTGISRARAARLVEERTADLQRVNRNLGAEVEERRRSEDRMRLMTRELDHRVKNNMAAVLSIVDHTVRNSESLDQFTEAFSGRIMAMARLHNVLTQSRWTGADLASLIKQIVEPYTVGLEGRVVIRGEPLTLSSKAVPSVAMALHELATNAAKYGALSAEDGKIDIQWTREKLPDGQEQVRLVWSEGGGPPVGEPTRRGFGRDLIEVAVPFEVSGRANLEFAPGGVRCVLVVPLGTPGEPPSPGPPPGPPSGSPPSAPPPTKAPSGAPESGKQPKFRKPS